MTRAGAGRLILEPFSGDEGAAASVARGASGAGPLRGLPAALPGALNMAVDEALLASAMDGAPPVLRFYRWAPACLSFGRNEPARGHYDAGAAAAAGVDLVRRPTGGLAVHHAEELTYAVVGRVADLGRPRQAYLRINQALVAGLRAVGLPAAVSAGAARLSVGEPGACFALPAEGEVVCGGRKLVGSAQRREGHALLQHGSILLAGDQSLVARLRTDAPARAPGVPPSPGSTTVAAVLGRSLCAVDLVGPLADAFCSVLGIRFAPAALDSIERGRALALEARYRTDEWTWRR